MKQPSFTIVGRILLLALSVLTGFSSMAADNPAADRSFFQIKIYHLSGKSNESQMDQYLKNAFIPAAHKAGIEQVGVFKPVEEDTSAGKLIYVLLPFKNMDQWLSLEGKLEKDKNYIQKGESYLNASHDQAPYQRVESIILRAFPDMPQMHKPALTSSDDQQVFELRSYEGPTEKYYQNKVKMFNEGGEIEIFDRLKFNAVFYAEVLSGSHMPNLMYMTSFDNMEERDKHWEAFGADPAWKKLSAQEEYQNNVSHADIFLLHPTSYSDL